MKVVQKLVSLLLAAVCLTLPVLAHSGRTDSSGGHRDTQNVSGLGSYHYHHGYGPHLHPDGICPYSSTAQAPAKASTSPATDTPSSSISSSPTITDAQKAAFLDKQIALIQSGQTIYHTLDCVDFEQTEEFIAYNVATAKAKKYTACIKCHS